MPERHDVFAEMRRLAHEAPNGDPYELGKCVLQKFNKNDLLPVVADGIAHEQRLVVHSAEQHAFRRKFQANVDNPITVATSAETWAEFRQLFNASFKLGDGASVRWGEATVDQHRQRIAMLEKQRDGLTNTINRHEQAIRLIEDSGAQCLEDLDD